MPQNQPQNQWSTLRTGGTLFNFIILEPGSTTGEPVTFPAFINSISDNFNPEWGQYNDMGRGDPKVMYKSFSRSINISFKILASKREGEHSAFDNYVNKMNILAKAVYPHYIGGKGFVGRFIKFNIAKLYNNEYGYLTSLTFNIDNNTPWDVDNAGQGERPIIIECDMGINWIGDMRPDANKSLAYSTREADINYPTATPQVTETLSNFPGLLLP